MGEGKKRSGDGCAEGRTGEAKGKGKEREERGMLCDVCQLTLFWFQRR